MKFKLDRYATESGRTAVVTAVDMPGHYPILGYILNAAGPPDVALWTASGRHSLGGDGLRQPSQWFAVERHRTLLYPPLIINKAFATQADAAAYPSSPACVHVGEFELKS